MFRITDGKGFQMTFDNGWTISVQFGPGNYCANQSMSDKGGWTETMRAAGEKGSMTAEVAAWDKDGKWYDFGSDSVKGYMTTDYVLDFMNEIRSK